jgi:hypothetical protein
VHVRHPTQHRVDGEGISLEGHAIRQVYDAQLDNPMALKAQTLTYITGMNQLATDGQADVHRGAGSRTNLYSIAC